VGKPVLMDLLDEVAQHLLGHVEVGRSRRPSGADRRDRPRRAADIRFASDADRVHLAGALVDRDHRRLREDDPGALE